METEATRAVDPHQLAFELQGKFRSLWENSLFSVVSIFSDSRQANNLTHKFETEANTLVLVKPEDVKISKILGEGQVGIVYSAYHKIWKKEIAIKTPHDIFKYDKGVLSVKPDYAKNLYQSELEVLRKMVNTPNFVQLLGYNDTLQWIVMKQYVAPLQSIIDALVKCRDITGDNFHKERNKYLRDKFPQLGNHIEDDSDREYLIPKKLLWFWSGQLYTGLRQMNFKFKVMHKDIKPSNILIDSNGDLIYTDFGSSQQSAHAAPLYQMDNIFKYG
jgi:serine/threonine protein kinase